MNPSAPRQCQSVRSHACGLSATRIGNLVSVKARVELKAVNTETGRAITADRQTTAVVDLTEQIAGKKALQDAAGNTTTFAYDQDTGLRTAVTDPLSTTVYTAYNLHGQVWRTWGGGAYPLEYLYDDTYGRLQYLETFRGGTGWSTSTWPTTTGDADVTEWSYHTATGLLTAKTYADSKGTTYAYDSAGRLATRTWARQVSSQALVTTYSYDANTGELTGIAYSDATPAVALTYTRTGQKHTVTDVAGTHTFAYTGTLDEDSESIDGSLYTKLLTRKYDSLGRSGGFQIGTSGYHDANYDVTYSYDSEGRFGELETAVPSSFTATYGYVTNSNLVGTVTFPNSIVATKSYEPHRDLLAAIENKVGTTTISKYEYPTNDAAGRRTAADWSGSAFTQGDTIGYGYNARSEVTGATATNRTAYDFDYSYDNIGNRVTYAVQGQTPPTEYVMPTNGLNQYSGITDPDEAFVYDYDGNLTLDRDFEYTWDAENRLHSVTAATVMKVEFTYDYMSRRVRKVSYEWQSGAWVQQTDQKLVYDGWNPVLELASGGALPASTARTWGLDLSQTLQGAGLPAIAWQATAGGVGGLLATHLSTSSQVNAFVYDGNGNVSEALRVSNGSIEAHYEYDPFGGTTASSGTWAGANPYRFSTKWFDDETSLYYYGLRYYTPRLGRWLSRDPIEEFGGLNLYGFIGNDPISNIDPTGEIKYDFDKKKCVLKVTLTWSLKFENQTGFPNWTSRQRSQWKRNAENAVETYFENVPLRCHPASVSCCLCPGGVTIDFNLRYKGFFTFWRSDDYVVTVLPDPNHQSSVSSTSGSGTGEFDNGDVNPQNKGASMPQVPIIHETGHMLGLNHPGGRSNDDAAYNADIDSLMGGGATLRLPDFNKAFCDKISAGSAGCDPWGGR